MPCAGSMRAYVYSDVLALFAAERYDVGLAQLGNASAHLTNTCQAASAGASEDDLVKLLAELPAVQ